jgi:hypothetical protein
LVCFVVVFPVLVCCTKKHLATLLPAPLNRRISKAVYLTNTGAPADRGLSRGRGWASTKEAARPLQDGTQSAAGGHGLFGHP